MAKDEIRRGYEFASKEGKFWEALAEGQGVVVTAIGTRGFIAHCESLDAESIDGDDRLRKFLQGASYNHEGNAFLVNRENGKLVWRTKEQLAGIPRKSFLAKLPFVKKKSLEFAGSC